MDNAMSDIESIRADVQKIRDRADVRECWQPRVLLVPFGEAELIFAAYERALAIAREEGYAQAIADATEPSIFKEAFDFIHDPKYSSGHMNLGTIKAGMIDEEWGQVMLIPGKIRQRIRSLSHTPKEKDTV